MRVFVEVALALALAVFVGVSVALGVKVFVGVGRHRRVGRLLFGSGERAVVSLYSFFVPFVSSQSSAIQSSHVNGSFMDQLLEARYPYSTAWGLWMSSPALYCFDWVDGPWTRPRSVNPIENPSND